MEEIKRMVWLASGVYRDSYVHAGEDSVAACSGGGNTFSSVLCGRDQNKRPIMITESRRVKNK
jgi:hypothetical protein